MDLILHITRREDWEQARSSGSYRADTLLSDGFIHCSTAAQVLGVANTWFRGQADLVLLCIDRARVDAEIRDENLEGGEQRFPHVYGPLPLAAIVHVAELPPQPDGTFRLPASVPG